MGNDRIETIRLVTKGCPDPKYNSSKDELIYWKHTCG